MKRKIICIDEEKCNGCGLCAEACHEGAIGMVDGNCLLYTSPSPRDRQKSRMPSSA